MSKLTKAANISI